MRCFCLLAVVVALLGFAGCGGTEETSTGPETVTKARAPSVPEPSLPEINVSLDGWEGPGTVGLLIAYQREFFADEGIAATILVSGGGAALKYVAQGGVDLAVVHQPQIATAKGKGAPVVAVGSLVPRATAAMIWKRGSGIEDVSDLRGRTIAIEGLPFQKLFLAQALARRGLTLDDVRVKSVGYELVPALVSGRVDAIFGGSWNLEGAALKALRAKPAITRLRRLGIPGYEDLVVAARRDLLAEGPQLVEKFMAAVARGTRVAVDDPKAAVAAVEQADEANPKLSHGAIVAEVEATLPLLSGNGSMSPRRAGRLVDWMWRKGMIQRRFPPAAILAEGYGQGG
jgi:putative hydroxymethylpyrimidine transport system substrate-binding protein